MGVSLFREGCDAGVHRLMLLAEVHVMRPVIAFCFLTRFCRERLLGRNLITVFPTVNNLSQFFFAVRSRRSRRDAARLLAHDVRRTRGACARPRACVHANAKTPGKKRFSRSVEFADACVRIASRAADRPRVSTRTSMRRRARRRANDVAFARRTSPFAQNCANFFRATRAVDASRAAVRGFRKRRTRGVRRGFG